MPETTCAIIGGTGVYHAELLADSVEHVIHTPYGDAKCVVGLHEGRPVAFMPRHGVRHNIPPHEINYRANIMALKQLGVRDVFATAAVGSLRRSLAPGSLVIIDQFLDFTKARHGTFFSDGAPVSHVDMTTPYCPRLRGVLQDTAAQLELSVAAEGVYVCTEGPRFETPAEIRAFAQMGGDVVGMTSVPEVVLAREAGICYASVAMVTNYGAGLADAPLTHREVLDEMARNADRLRRLFFTAIAHAKTGRACSCAPPAAMVSTEGDRP